MEKKEKFKTGDICYVINRDFCDGTPISISDHTAIIVEKLDKYR